MQNKLLDLIKKYDNIVIARHIGGDPDALGSTFALKEIIESNFEGKNVKVVGSPISKFKFFGHHDKVTEEESSSSLLIALDIPDIKRIDSADFYKFKEKIKIDHHPKIDEFSKYDIVNENASSTCEIIASLAYEFNLKIPKHASQCLFLGIIADTNRFLFGVTSPNTYKIVSRLVGENNIDTSSLYSKLYRRDISEVRLEGFISLNMNITKDGVGSIKITKDDLKKYKVDSASIGGIMNNYNYINNLIVWTVFVEDVKNNVIRAYARSRGPIINKLFEQYNGGGHMYACGAKLNSFSEADEIIEKLNNMCKTYNIEENN